MSSKDGQRGFLRKAFYDDNDQLRISEIPAPFKRYVYTAVLGWGFFGFMCTISGLKHIHQYVRGQEIRYLPVFFMGLCFIQLTILNAKRCRFLWKLRQDTPYPAVLKMPFKIYVSEAVTDVVWLSVIVILGGITFLLDKLPNIN